MLEVEVILLVAELEDMAEVNTFGEDARLGQLVLSLCLRSSSG